MINAKLKQEDSRPLCKYGSSCYQKNKEHVEKFKHPDTKVTKEKEKVGKVPNSKSLKQQTLNFTRKTLNDRKNENNTNNSINAEESNSTIVDTKSNSTENTTKENSEHSVESHTNPEFNHVSVNINIDVKKVIKDLFLVDMPEDFYSFWEFCKSLHPEDPSDALESLDLKLVGPFDVLSGNLTETNVEKTAVLRHWRYYYDPPEFQTVIKSNGEDLFHMGYFRDDPKRLPEFVASNYAAKDCYILSTGENLFAALEWYIKQTQKVSNPFKKMKLTSIKSDLHNWAKKNNYTLEKRTTKMHSREKSTVCKTYQQVGIVVPYDQKTELGYRPLSETPSAFKKLLTEAVKAKTKEERAAAMDKIYTVVNWANIAMDEGDFGTNLELGLNLFSLGSDIFNSIILHSLETAYSLLNRNAFIPIIKAHLEDRKEGGNLSIIK